MDIIALQKTLCYELTRNDLKDALGKDYIDVILYCFFKNSIEKSDLKDIFIESQMQEIFKTFKIKIYHKNEKIYDVKSPDKAKTNNKRMIVVIEGSIYKNDESDELVAEKGGIIGGDLFKDLNKGLPEDLVVNPDSVEATTPAAIDQNDTTSISYAVKLNAPGDFYEFTVDIVNAGTLPGKINVVTIDGISTYSNIVEIKYLFEENN